MTLALRKTPLVTIDDFLAMAFDDDTRYELVDGEVVAQAHPSRAHGAIQSALARHIGNALDGTACQPVTEAGIRPHFDPTHNYRAADLAVTCEPFDEGIPYLEAPILLVEILSPTEEAKQRAKLHVYAAMPSVREILFLDSLSMRAELHRRDAGGLWPERPEVLIGDETLRLDTVALEMPLSRLYQGLNLPVGDRVV
ncbi:Uma2 family endonuclease [Azospirillum sp.]|uniref:Uma2 family endonuclease n=1 Tax=Azospirillum sp. TaxID=34012 RepID=UPI002D6735D0|nr:Uma2 family endonuclease [Azospirillum sp.]HYD68135.1 Uma2 family endonuclease [Azospirillum sp.]